ncbi:insulin-like growth factor-binding protein 6a [Synchiropus splendidus]|uniref:insulin-like growth factor-binding protein 6a n=1 Tax=Synchiropus splendidus TaxID=270530 RepID=UPI00237E60CB|nr:insulin-like growth factor-binding protein 6a [Synchiropus splendidus]
MLLRLGSILLLLLLANLGKAKPLVSTKDKDVDLDTSLLTDGEPCGVYTQTCARGLRCVPPEDDPRPLRSLLDGKGSCRNISSIESTAAVLTEDSETTVVPEEAPCRKALMALLKGFDGQLFKPHHEVYLPNCDKQGFFKKKQCWSSRGKQRGKCWCVDEDGTPVTSPSKHKGTLAC